MSNLCVCGATFDQDECQCSLKNSDCITIDGSGRLIPLSFNGRFNPDPDNLWSCVGDGHLIELPSYLRSPPRVSVTHNAAQSTTNDTAFVVAFNTENYDTEVMHDVATLNSRLTIVTAGVYTVTFVCAFTGNVTGDRFAAIRKNGNEYLGFNAKRALVSATPECGLSVTVQEKFLVGEFLEAVVKQDSGGALNLLSTSAYTPQFSAVFRRLYPSD